MSAPADNRQLRVGVGGIATESSTFSPHRTGLSDFTVTRGDAQLERYPWVTEAADWAEGVAWIPTLYARALPGGPVEPGVYRSLKAELIAASLAVAPLDGFLVDIHGAMNVAGMEDAEADLVGELRASLGADALLSASLDLHGNVSERLATLLDLVTCYRTAPHVDEAQTRERAARTLVERLRTGGRPQKAWISVPVLLTGEKTSTRTSPAADVYGRVAEVAARDGVIDASVWVGYAWADEPRSGAAVIVTGDDRELIMRSAEALASEYWDARGEFRFAAPAASFAACLTTALASSARPYFISDSGDNPTAGGAGDVSFALSALLASPAITAVEASVIYASIVDPDAVATAFGAGTGSEVSLALGGKIDPRPCGPAQTSAIVEHLVVGDQRHCDMAVVRRGGLHCIATARRAPFHRIADFERLGLDVAGADLVIVKIGYLEPELYEAAADWMLALTPGGVDQDLAALPYQSVSRPIYPLDDAEAPRFEARLL